MKILHVASFDGNIGDALSHAGLYKILTEDYGIGVEDVFRLDIRRFYKNATYDQLFFNKECAVNFNKYDLVVIGGGGYLKQAFENSISGNTFDFETGFLSTVKTKVLFYSIGGLDPRGAMPDKIYERTEYFFDNLFCRPNFEFIFRQDGSVSNSEYLSDRSQTNCDVNQIHDSAYLNDPGCGLQTENYVIVNIGHDQAVQSFDGLNDVITRTGKIIERLHEADRSTIFKFAPHTYYDVEVFTELCGVLPERLKRNNLKCLETFSLYCDLDNVIAAYGKARFALTGRYHSAALAFLYTRSFMPLYLFARVMSQLNSIGLNGAKIATPETALEAFLNKTIEMKKIADCETELQENKNITKLLLRKFLES